MILIDAERLSASRPDRPLFTDVSLTISDGDRVGVVGINGCGKSTLLRMLARSADVSTGAPEGGGTVRWARGIRVGVLDQSPKLEPGSVSESVGHGWQGEAMLQRLGMGALMDAPTDELSGGQAKRVALAKVLVAEHDALILDEPTNHLDLDAIAFLEEWLAAYRGGLVMVTHDRHVLDRVTTRVLEIDRGRAYLHLPTGWHAGSGYAAYLDGRATREEQAEAAERTRRSLARTELAWLRRGAPARTSKPKARIASATALVEARPDAPARAGELGLALGSQRLGSKGVELAEVSFRWPSDPAEAAPVLDRVVMALEPGDRIGLVGPNGAGKSTLLDLVAERLEPTSGTIARGATVQVGYYDQLGRDLDPAQRVRDAVAGDKGEPSLADLALMRRFWFDGDAQFARIGLLSGGERRRLQLLLVLVEQPNVLLLDEPTNDLDLDTLRALEDLLDDWKGIVVVVSHDRVFLDRVVDDVVALDGRGGVVQVRGGVAGWLEQRAADAANGGGPGTSTGRAAPATTARSGPGQSGPGQSGPGQSGTGQSRTGQSRTGQSRTGQAGRSPSTVRRQLGVAEREVAAAVVGRDAAVEALSAGGDHRDLAAASDALAAAQQAVDAAEERWLALADEAEQLGLDV